ncbi:MAG: hypothetical protein ACRECH_14725 [Nitrososphaerales archaeon]
MGLFTSLNWFYYPSIGFFLTSLGINALSNFHSETLGTLNVILVAFDLALTPFLVGGFGAAQPAMQDAISWILRDFELDDRLSLPSLDLIIVVDILHVLDQSGSQGFIELLSRLRTLHNSNGLSLYLDSLLGLNMISRKEIKYKEAIPVKSIFDVTESGKILLKVMEQAQRAGYGIDLP